MKGKIYWRLLLVNIKKKGNNGVFAFINIIQGVMDSKKEEYVELARSEQYEVCIWGAGFLGTQKGLELLSKRNITVDYYCDGDLKLWDKEIVSGIKCISPTELKSKKEKMICFVFLASSKVDSVLQQLSDMGIEKIVLFDDLFIEEKEEYFPFMKRKQIACYTCIVGDYDNLQEPLSISPECDYYLISDKKPKRETVFQYIEIDQYLPKDVTDNTRKNRFCKINAHKIFPQYKYSIYFDGVFRLDASITKFIQELPRTRIMTSYKHYWPGLYMEAMRVILNKRDTEEVVKKQIEHYWLEGMPENFGSVFCNILIREHNNPICKKIMEDWWSQIERFSRRDMISFPYVIWKNGYSIADVKTIMDSYQMETMYWKEEKKHNQPRVVYEGKEVY